MEKNLSPTLQKLKNTFQYEFNILTDYGHLTREWSNVYAHCEKEAEVAVILSELLKLNDTSYYDLVSAAILHDWYKRHEREAANASGHMAYGESEKKSAEGLRKLGITDRVIEIAHSVGSLGLNEIEDCNDVLRLAMHYIDDITSNTEIVEINERCDRLERIERYKEWNEYGRTLYNGKTMFEKQREVGMIVQNKLEYFIGLEPNTLTQLIKQKL